MNYCLRLHKSLKYTFRMIQKVKILSKIQDVSLFCNHRKFNAEKRDKCIVAYNKIDQYITSYGPNM